jgi:predicted Zn-dependent protease
MTSSSGARRLAAVPARAALLAVAVLVAGWLATGYPGAHDEARAKALLARPAAGLGATERAQALALLHGARRGRPDGGVLLREAALLITTGRRAEAAARLRPLVRREPESVTAWTLLGLADPGLAAEAASRRRALAPPVR